MTTRITITQDFMVSDPPQRLLAGQIFDDIDDSEAAQYVAWGVAVLTPLAVENSGPVMDVEGLQEEALG